MRTEEYLFSTHRWGDAYIYLNSTQTGKMVVGGDMAPLGFLDTCLEEECLSIATNMDSRQLPEMSAHSK